MFYNNNDLIYKQTCKGEDGKGHVNLLCPVDVNSQPEKTLPDIQSSSHAVDMLKFFEKNMTDKVSFRKKVWLKL